MNSSLKIFLSGVVAALVFMAGWMAVTQTPDAWAVSEVDEYYDRIRVLNEILSEVQLKYVDEDKIQTADLIQSAIEGVLNDLDPHCTYLPPKKFDDFKEDTRGTFGGLGITIDIRDGWPTVISPLPDTPAFREGILAGDKIIKIEDESTEGMDIVKDVVPRLRGEPGTKVTITIFRPSDQSEVDHTIVRDIIRVPNVYAYVIDDHIGYIRLFEFKQTASTDLNRVMDMLDERNIDGLVLDLRFNSGGLLDQAVAVSDKFLPKGKEVVSIRGRDQEINKPYVSREDARCKLPLVVLVNQASASASEIVAGAMQDWGRAILVGPSGARTYGKGSVQTVIPLSNDSALKLTTAKYYTPEGRSIEDEEGIEPDVKVDITEDDIRKLLELGRLGKLRPDRYKEEQLWPPPGLDDMAAAEAEVESATVEGEAEPVRTKDDFSEQPEVYDRELAEAIDIIKTQRIWASAKNLFE
jgi:carboxyl-terminal processing protease